MITADVSIDQKLPEVKPLSENTENASQRANSPQKTNGVKPRASTSVKINDSLLKFSVSQLEHTAINMVADSVRQSDLAMLEIEKQINEMKARLAEHVKHFPPFLPGSEERVKLMRRFSALRHQIDQLTFPPNNAGAAHIMADPSITGFSGDWKVDIDDDNHQITIRRQPVHTGPKGLNIPELPETATDEEIQVAMETLDSAKELIVHRRSDLAADFKQILNQMKIGA